MKERLKKIVVAICIGMIMSITAVNTLPRMYTVVEAATKKVVKVTSKEEYKDGTYSRVILYGKAKDGSIVWKYTSPYQSLTELPTNEYFINNKFIYLFSDKLYAISKSTGKVKWTYKCSLGGVSTAFDKNGDMYFTGYYLDTIYCISPEGKLKFKSKIPSQYYWPYEIELSGNEVQVYVEEDSTHGMGSYRTQYLIFDKKGKYYGFDKPNWKTAYKKFFKKDTILWGGSLGTLDKMEFAFVDIDQNDVPELVLRNKDASPNYGVERVFGYDNGGIMELYDGDGYNIISYDKKSKMFCSHSGEKDRYLDEFYVIENNQAVCVAQRVSEQVYNGTTNTYKERITYYSVKAKDIRIKISKKQFEKMVGEGWDLDTDGSYKRGFTFKKVTNANLKKYL